MEKRGKLTRFPALPRLRRQTYQRRSTPDTATPGPEVSLSSPTSSAQAQLKSVESSVTASKLPDTPRASNQQRKTEVSSSKAHAGQGNLGHLWTQAFEIFRERDHGQKLTADYTQSTWPLCRTRAHLVQTSQSQSLLKLSWISY